MERIAIGMIGCGFFAQNHLYAWTDLKHEGADLVAVCDIDPVKARAAGEKFDARWYTDAAEMLEKEHLGLVDIATQVRTHLMLAELTLAKRIPTIVQKPFGQDIAEVRKMVALGRDAGVFLAVHENFRYQLPMLKAAEIIRSGRIGTPNWGRVSFRTNYDIYKGQPYLAKETRFALMDLGVHVLDLARFFLGEVEHVTAELQKRNSKVAGEDTATMMLRHTSGAVSIVECTYEAKRKLDSFPETLIEIEGDKGAIVGRVGARLEVTSDGKMEEIDADPMVLPWAERPWHVAQDSVLALNRHFLQCVQEGRDADTSAADNLKTFALVEAAYETAGKVKPAVTLREGRGNVAIIAATIASLDAEEQSGADAATLLGVAAPGTWPPEYNDAATREWMRGVLREHPDEPGYGSWYIIGDGRLVGTAGYKGPPGSDGAVEIGYAVIASEQRKGYASGAVSLLVDRAFRDARVSAVFAETIPALAGSQAVLARCGFELVGRTPDDEVGEILRYARRAPVSQ